VPVALLATYGILRFSTTLFQELRDVVFVRVAQRAMRRIALGVFRHLHSLSLRFHLERQTGGMTRDIERGTNGISTLLSYLLFSILPGDPGVRAGGCGAPQQVRLALRRSHLRRGRALHRLHRARHRVAHGDPAPRQRARLEGQQPAPSTACSTTRRSSTSATRSSRPAATTRT
jgi:ABC-type multidrug transport system fused ATPase/permease subunit